MVSFSGKNQIVLVIAWLFCFSLSGPQAQQEVYLKIQSEGFQPINIAVSPFVCDFRTDITDQLRQIVINDLTLSGFFRIVDEVGFIRALTNDNGSRSPMTAIMLLEGSLEFKGSTISLAARLVELPNKNLIFKKKFSLPLSSMRWLAHQVADEVGYYLIGERGIACTQIAFVTSNSAAKEIAVVDYDGYGLKQLTFTGSLNLSPRWSPDGERLAFTSFVAGNPDLMLLYLNEGKITKISNQQGLNTAPAWSPDGKKLALTLTRDGNPEIYIMDIKGANLRRLTNHPAIDSSPSWSPNGRELAFTSDRSGSPQIYLMDAEGGNVRRLTFQGSYNDSPAWSPRGDRIAFVSREENQFHIYTIDVNGEDLRRITDGVGNNENPCWSPDGLRIAFASNRDGKWDIYVVNWDGSQLRRLTSNGGNVSPTWSPRLVGK